MIPHTRLLSAILLLGVCPHSGGRELSDLSGAGTDTARDRSRFSNTQSWKPEYFASVGKKPRYLPEDWTERIQIPKPPANSSSRTRAELARLHELRESRGEKQAEVRKELLSNGFQFGKLRYGTIVETTKRPATRRMFEAADPDLKIVIFSLKHRYDRVRPSVLDPELGQLFPVPPHPAYPSGHSTQAFTIAYLLQELDPKNSETYVSDALRIAHNREIAGFHYPSDTTAGRLAARQLVDLLLTNPEFRSLLEAAKREW